MIANSIEGQNAPPPPRCAGDGASGQAAAGVAVEALHVIAPAGYEGFVPHFDLQDAERTAAGKLRGFFAGAGCGNRWIPCRACFGGPREEILKHIEATAPDLVIMGTHGLGGFERLMLGSVAESVVRSGNASILVIPPLAAA